jgi:hypothetical protein
MPDKKLSPIVTNMYNTVKVNNPQFERLDRFEFARSVYTSNSNREKLLGYISDINPELFEKYGKTFISRKLREGIKQDYYLNLTEDDVKDIEQNKPVDVNEDNLFEEMVAASTGVNLFSLEGLLLPKSASVEILQKQNEPDITLAVPESEASKAATVEEIIKTAQTIKEFDKNLADNLFDNLYEQTKDNQWQNFKDGWSLFFGEWFILPKEDFTKTIRGIEVPRSQQEMMEKRKDYFKQKYGADMDTFSGKVKALGEMFKDLNTAFNPVENYSNNAFSSTLNNFNRAASIAAMPITLPGSLAIEFADDYNKTMKKSDKFYINPLTSFMISSGLTALKMTSGFMKFAGQASMNTLLADPVLGQRVIRPILTAAGKSQDEIDLMFDRATQKFFSGGLVDMGASIGVLKMGHSMTKSLATKGRLVANQRWGFDVIRPTKFYMGKELSFGKKGLTFNTKPKYKITPERRIYDMKVSGLHDFKTQVNTNSNMHDFKVYVESGLTFDEAFAATFGEAFKKKTPKQQVYLNTFKKNLKKNFTDIYGDSPIEVGFKFDATGVSPTSGKYKNVSKRQVRKVNKKMKDFEAKVKAVSEALPKYNKFKEIPGIKEGLSYNDFLKEVGVKLNFTVRKMKQAKVQKKFKDLYSQYIDGQVNPVETRLKSQQIIIDSFTKSDIVMGILNTDEAFKLTPKFAQALKTTASKHHAITNIFLEGSKYIKTLYPDPRVRQDLMLFLEKPRNQVPNQYLKGYDLWHKQLSPFGKNILAKQGHIVDFKARIKDNLVTKREQLNKTYSRLKLNKSKKNAGIRKVLENRLTEINKAISNVDNMEYVHIPTRMWLESSLSGNNYLKFTSALNVLNSKARKNLRLIDMVNSGLIKKSALDPIDMLGSYGSRVAYDVVVGNFINAGVSSGFIKSHWIPKKGGGYFLPKDVKPKKGFIMANSLKTPIVKGYSYDPRLQKYFDEFLPSIKPNSDLANMWKTYMRGTKIMTFSKMLLMGTYDTYQGAMAGTFDFAALGTGGFLTGKKIGGITGEAFAHYLGVNPQTGKAVGKLFGSTAGTAAGLLVGRKSLKGAAKGLKSWWNKDANFYTGDMQGTYSTPITFKYTNLVSSMEQIKNNYGENVFNKLGNKFSNDFNKFIKADDLEKAKMLALAPVNSTIGNMYRFAWNTTWGLDRAIRSMTRQVFIEKGYSSQEASHYAAKFHGDYANIPRANAKLMNNLLYTPTFKAAMFDLLNNMFTGAAGLRGKKDFSVYGPALARTVGILIGVDYFMTNNLGLKRLSFARSYYKDTEGPKGIYNKDLVYGLPQPFSFQMKGVDKIYNIANNQIPLDMESYPKQFLSMNWNEIHPAYRIIQATLLEPEKFNIYNINDDPSLKIKKTIAAGLYMHVPMLENIRKNPYDKRTKDAMTVMDREIGKMGRLAYSAVSYYYLAPDKETMEFYNFKNFQSEGKPSKFDMINATPEEVNMWINNYTDKLTRGVELMLKGSDTKLDKFYKNINNLMKDIDIRDLDKQKKSILNENPDVISPDQKAYELEINLSDKEKEMLKKKMNKK